MTQGLSAAELAQIRADIGQLFPDTCSVLGITRTSDGAGGWTDTAGTITGGTAVPCRLDFPNPGKEAMAAGAVQSFKTGIVSMAYDKTITTANQIQIGTDTYNIVGVNTNQSWIGVKRLAVEKIP